MATLTARLSHVLPLGSAVSERGHLEIGGCDAVELARLPVVEIHLSDIERREAFRQVSVLDGLCCGRVFGKGPDGYRDGLTILREELST